jgi:stage V sporulation protein S
LTWSASKELTVFLPVSLAQDEELPKKPLEPIWIRPDSNVDGIAQLLVSSILEDRRITLRAIGAGAINQAVKGMIRGNQRLAGAGESMYFIPGFTTVKGNDDKDVTAVVFHCLLRD